MTKETLAIAQVRKNLLLLQKKFPCEVGVLYDVKLIGPMDPFLPTLQGRS